MSDPIRTGVLGYGLAAGCFHLPYLQSMPQFDVRAVVTSRVEAHAALPDVHIISDPEDVIHSDDIELIVIATPHRLHMSQAIAAIEAGKHVVIEKPVTVTSADVVTLGQAAERAGKLAIPFHNRRWDGDFRAVQDLLKSRILGSVHYFESRWLMFRPKPRGVWRDDPAELGGVFFDLGPHLIDQCLQLFGTPRSVYAQIMTHRPGCTADDAFRIQLTYDHGLVAVLEMDVLNGVSCPRFTIRGTNGAFEKQGVDPQESLLRAGVVPGSAAWVLPEEKAHIVLGGESGLTIRGDLQIPAGDYGQFYAGVFAAIRSSAKPPVTLAELAQQVRVIEAARESSRSGLPVRIEAT